MCFFWSVLLVIMQAHISTETLERIWKTLLFVAAVQLPFVFYQHFVVMPQRAAMWAFDAVVGTFGGDPVSGGANITLVLYALVASLYATALYRNSLLQRKRWVAVLGISGIVIILGEVKLVVVLIPTSFFILYLDRFRQNWRSLVRFTLVVTVGLMALLAFYQAVYWDDSLRSRGIVESMEKSVSYIVDPYNMTLKTGEVGRFASLHLWWSDPKTDVIQRLVGYGLGASRSRSTVALGEVAQRYWPYDINSTAMAMLLWDAGILGFVCFSSLVLCGAFFAYRLSSAEAIPIQQRAGLRTASSALVCLFIMIPYNRYIVDQSPEQLLMVFCLGYAMHCYRKWKMQSPSAAVLDVMRGRY